MQLTPAQINSFKDLYKNKYQIELSDSESLEQLTKLISLVKTIYRPITIDQYLKTKLTQIKLYENREQENA
jgi:hypothetical protein